MARRKKPASIDEKSLSKGQVRKLNALRKSLGDDIAERAFAEWLESEPDSANGGGQDRNARTITEALHPLIEAGELRIPRGGYSCGAGVVAAGSSSNARNNIAKGRLLG
jgi:hypothetical protein